MSRKNKKNTNKTTNIQTTAKVTTLQTQVKTNTPGETATMTQFHKEAKVVYKNTCANDPDIADFMSICKLEKTELKAHLKEWAEHLEMKIHDGDGYLLIEGDKDYPVLVTAHMDTVHKELIKDYYMYEGTSAGTVLTSPQGIGGDDRCGIYMITELVKRDYHPWILFCEDEEIGGVGSNKFVITEDVDLIADLKFFIELDRANDKDAVYYSCDNKEFKKWIENFGFEKAYGSFSDISHLSPATDTASVNLSCGYYNAHTTNEYVVWEEMIETINKVTEILDAVKAEPEMEKYDYQKEVSTWGRYGSYGRGSYYYDDYEDYNYGKYGNYGGYGSYGYSSKSTSRKSYAYSEGVETSYTGYFYYTDADGREEYEEEIKGDSKLSCIAKFLMEHSDISWDQVLDYVFDTDL